MERPFTAAKRELRAAALRRLATLDAEQRRQETGAICPILEELTRDLRPGVLAAYVALSREVDLGPVLDRWLRGGRALALPFQGETGPEFRAVSSLARLVPGPSGVRQPAPSEPRVAVADIDLVLVPGLAFDARGTRLGRGGGFYDRLLAEPVRSQARVGIGFAVQMIAELPREPHDVPVQGCVTAEGLRWFR